MPTAKNSIGTQLYGPAGGAIWNTPTIDARRNVLYVGTGNNFAPPATELSDSLVALDLNDRRGPLVPPGHRERHLERQLPAAQS